MPACERGSARRQVVGPNQTLIRKSSQTSRCRPTLTSRGASVWAGARGITAVRRTVDLVVAMLVGLIALPFIAVVALLVLLAMGRPVFFRQRRSGLLGAEFSILKFRTMRPERYA